MDDFLRAYIERVRQIARAPLGVILALGLAEVAFIRQVILRDYDALTIVIAAAAGFVFGQIIEAAAAYLRANRRRKPRTEAEREAQAEAAREELRSAYEAMRGTLTGIDDVSYETAELLLETAKDSFEKTSDANERLESKATQLLSLVAGASGALGVFGSVKGTALVPTPALYAAISMVGVAFVSLLYMLRPRTIVMPDIGAYLSAATVREDNRAALSLTIAQRYVLAQRTFRDQSVTDPNALVCAYGAIAFAGCFAVIAALTPKPPTAEAKAPPARVVHTSSANHATQSPGPRVHAVKEPRHERSPHPAAN